MLAATMTSLTSTTTPAPVSLFYSYAHEDEALRDELQDHLAILERRRVIQSWHDRAIVPGHDWSQEIDSRLRAAELVLLLISKDFIASDYIMGVELDLAMQRQQRGEATVVPILLRPVDLQPEDAVDMPFVDLLAPQGLPRDLKPVTTWANRDEAWTQVAGGLRATVNAIRARRQARLDAEAAPMTASISAPAMPAVVPADHDMKKASAESRPAPAASTSPAIERVIGDVADRMVRATAAKGGPMPSTAGVREQARRLIDLREPPRVLWVDDHPQNNAAETGSLARLQIEVQTVRSTDEALARLSAAAAEARPYALVISDWTRAADGPLAGLRLLKALRDHGHPQALVYYHGTTAQLPRAALAAAAKAAGARGEATMPTELMNLVLSALAA